MTGNVVGIVGGGGGTASVSLDVCKVDDDCKVDGRKVGDGRKGVTLDGDLGACPLGCCGFGKGSRLSFLSITLF